MRPEHTSPAASRLTTLMADRRGFALEATLIVLVLISVLVGASVASYIMVQRSGSVDYRGTRVSYAAEAGADAVISQLAQSMTDAGYQTLVSIGDAEENKVGSNCGQYVLNYLESKQSVQDGYTYQVEEIG